MGLLQVHREKVLGLFRNPIYVNSILRIYKLIRFSIGNINIL